MAVDQVVASARRTLGETFAPNLIKCDVQGAELRALEGGRMAVSQAEAIVLEMPGAVFYNTGAPPFAAYVRLLDELGFTFFDIPEVHRTVSPVEDNRGGQNDGRGTGSMRSSGVASFIFQVDMIFVRSTSPLLKRLQRYLHGIEKAASVKLPGSCKLKL